MSPTWLVLLPVAALLLQTALASLDFPLGGRFTVSLPATYQPGFADRTTIGDVARERQPSFAAAVSLEDDMGRYMCSLVVLLGDVTVWASDHSVDKFAAQALCQLEITGDGQLRLTDGAGAVGWRSDTAGRGAKALHLDSRIGNLVLLDAQNRTLWQSFNNPTDKLLQGQWLRLPAYLTKISSATSAFYCFELHGDNIAAYLYFGQTKYSYWELTPSHNRSMAFVGMDESGLTMFDQRGRPVAQMSPAVKKAPVRFLALEDDGNLGLYFFDRRHKKFRASYTALEFCELPLSCGVSGVCSAAGHCNDFSAYGVWPAHGQGRTTLCNATASAEAHYMVEMRGVTTVLKTSSPLPNLTMQQCVDLCMRSCSCAAALYVKGNATADNAVCSHYELTAGAREVVGGSHRYSYWVKARKGSNYEQDGEEDDVTAASRMLNKVVIVFGAVDVTCLLVMAGVAAHYCFYLRRQPVDKLVTDEEGEAAGNDGGAAVPPNSNTNSGAVQN